MLDDVRFNLQCIKASQVAFEVESFASGDTFPEAVEDLITQVNNSKELPDTGEWFQTYYYTNEGDAYRFYSQTDIDEPEEEE